MKYESELVAKPETWDAVAETYNIELEGGDLQLANDIEKILTKNGLQQGDSLIEMGCGSGHLSLCLAQKGYKVTLIDFSTVALEKAKQTFERYGIQGEFILGDLFNLDESIPVCDFAWNSGVMEHFGDEEIAKLMSNISKYARKGVLYLVPNSNSIAYLLMRARLMSEDQWIYGDEYLRRDYDVLLRNLGYKFIDKSYVSTASISAYQMWKAEREQGNISELYKCLAEEKMLPSEEGYLVAYYASNCEVTNNVEKYTGSTVHDTKVFDLVSKKIGYLEQKDEIERKNIEIEQKDIEIKQKDIEIKQKNESIEERNKLLTVAHDRIGELEARLAEKENKICNLEKQIAEFKGVHLEEELNQLLQENVRIQQNYQMAMAVLSQKNEYMIQAQELCNHFATGKLMQLNHFLYRFKGQLLMGSKEGRKDFRAWLKGRIKGTNRTIGAGIIYNPWMVVNGKLGEGIACYPSAVTTGAATAQNGFTLPVGNPPGTESEDLYRGLPEATKQILQQDYTKYDVIILSVIDYNFRHQRPQHFAARFAANGHRVFYVNANFIRPDSIYIQEENLYVADFACDDHNTIYTMNGTDTLEWMKEKLEQMIVAQAIRDAVIIVDYPNWVYGAEYIREKYGFKMVIDYMDDYTGFLGTAEDFLKNNCIRLLQKSDVVVASSQFLYDVASKHTEENKITIVRNGTEVEHFYQAFEMETFQKEHKVIGYYGAVAHWFAWEKVCCLAKKFPECDIVIVGDVTEHRDKLEKHQNIKLLGEKPYKELPRYLADFDVCLIPFDTSTDLIKATNPVKFYEYLSAGKKIVATEIPELMPFRDEYVYMSNDDEKFAEYVKLCLEGKDSLKDRDACIEFAKENDWQKRYECFESACVAQIPMISVIVLTYNNLEMNKQCINSILKKTAYANYELIIIDNQSTDGTVEYLKELNQWNLSNIKVIFNNKNSGFAGGNNIGIKEAKGDYILLLNNDTVVTRGWLTAMAKHLENNSNYGMCNPVTNSIGNESKIRVYYHNLQEMQEFAYAVTAKNMNTEYAEVDRLPLFATLIRREAIDKAGMLDEAYKIGMFEDDDFTEAVKAADFKIVIAEDAFVHHINNGSFKNLKDEEYKRIFNTNKELFEKKWRKEWKMPKYREGVTADCNIEAKI